MDFILNERIKAAGATSDMEVVGTSRAAAFSGAFSPREGSLLSQLHDILDACDGRPAGTAP